jgi:hypothetical protein
MNIAGVYLDTPAIFVTGDAMNIAPPAIFVTGDAMNIAGEFTRSETWCTHESDASSVCGN